MESIREQTKLRALPGVVYVAGPMAGRPDHGFSYFEEVTRLVYRLVPGAIVKSPHQDVPHSTVRAIEKASDRTKCKEYQDVMRRDACMVLESSAVLLLPGWEESIGARFEESLARIVGTPLIDYMDGDWHVQLREALGLSYEPHEPEIPYYGD